MLSVFKGYIDSVTSPITAFINDREAVKQYFGIDSINNISNDLYQLIRQELETTDKDNCIPKSKFFELQDDLIKRYFLANEDPTPYIPIIKVINDSCRTSLTRFVSLENRDKWIRAIEIAKSFNELYPHFHFDVSKIRREYPEETDVALSLILLKKHGLQIEIDKDDVKIPASEVIFEQIDRAVREIGGINLTIFLLNLLNQNRKYSSDFERYLITRHTTLMTENVTPQIPFGYLFNLAAKYPYLGQGSAVLGSMQYILSLSVAACNGLYEVQRYNVFSFFTQTGDGMIKMLRDMALWDSIYSVTQARPKQVTELVGRLFLDIHPAVFVEANNFTLDDFIAVTKTIFSIAGKTNDPVWVYTKRVIKDVQGKVSAQAVSQILGALSHKGNANDQYTNPHDISAVDYFLKPLIMTEPDKFLLLNRSWNVSALFEVLANPLRNAMKQNEFDSYIGFQLENYIQGKLTDKGISFVSGKYLLDGVEGEADLIVETSTAVMLFEVKKKVLTRKSKSGIDTSIIIDLSESIFDSALQSGRTELLLQQYGQLELNGPNGKYLLELKNRVIERIGVTQMEYGGFHHKEIIKVILTSLLTHTFHPISKSDPAVNKKFDEFNKKREVWVKQYNELYQFSERYKHNPFFDLWFISINQLIEMIELSHSNDSFYEHLTMSKHVSIGTFEFFSEFSEAKRIKDSAPVAVSKNQKATWVTVPK